MTARTFPPTESWARAVLPTRRAKSAGDADPAASHRANANVLEREPLVASREHAEDKSGVEPVSPGPDVCEQAIPQRQSASAPHTLSMWRRARSETRAGCFWRVSGMRLAAHPTIRNLTLYKSSLGQVSVFRVVRALLFL